MILEGSRYANSSTSTFTRVPDETGTYYPTVFRTVPEVQSQLFRSHQWTDMDRWDLLADTYLGDPELYWQILDINPEILNPLVIASGTTIRIPLTGGF